MKHYELKKSSHSEPSYKSRMEPSSKTNQHLRVVNCFRQKIPPPFLTGHWTHIHAHTQKNYHFDLVTSSLFCFVLIYKKLNLQQLWLCMASFRKGRCCTWMEIFKSFLQADPMMQHISCQVLSKLYYTFFYKYGIMRKVKCIPTNDLSKEMNLLETNVFFLWRLKTLVNFWRLL